jgi:hypothetical protein
MNRLNRFLATLLMLCLTSGARAFDVAPVDNPQALGFSPSRLERIARWQQSQVNAGRTFALAGRSDVLRLVNADIEEHRGHASVALPTNHSPLFAPVPKPTIETGVEAMMLAVLSVFDQHAREK